MEIEHFDGITLEHICSDVFSCDRGGMGGIINSDTFAHNPLLASYLVIAKLYKNSKIQDKWETVFEYPDENENIHLKTIQMN